MPLIAVIVLLAGCATTTAGRPSPAAGIPTRTTPARAAAPAPSSRPTRVARVTAACPLLSPDELKSLLGSGASRTKLTAVEDKPDRTGGYPSYNCEYGANGRYPFVLGISVIPDPGYTPKHAIHDIAVASKVATHRVTGVGADGVFYTLPDGVSLLAASTQFRGETRTVIFSAPVIVPERKFIEVAKLVISRV